MKRNLLKYICFLFVLFLIGCSASSQPVDFELSVVSISSDDELSDDGIIVDMNDLTVSEFVEGAAKITFNQRVEHFHFIDVRTHPERGWVPFSFFGFKGEIERDVPLYVTNVASIRSKGETGFSFTTEDGTVHWYVLLMTSDGIVYEEFDFDPARDLLYVLELTEMDYYDAQVEEEEETASLTADGIYHVVARGDTLFNISQRYGLTVLRLQELNNMVGETLIEIGDHLRIIDDGRPTTQAPPPVQAPPVIQAPPIQAPPPQTPSSPPAPVLREIIITATIVDEIDPSYREVVYSRGRPGGRNIVITTDTPFSDFTIGWADMVQPESLQFNYGKTVGSFTPNQPIVITEHLEMSSINLTIFRLTDLDGHQRFFAMGICQMYGNRVFVWEIN